MFNYSNWRGGKFAAPVLIGQTTDIQLVADSLSAAPAAPFVVVFCSNVVDTNGFRTERESVLVTARTDDLITTCTRAYESGTGGGIARAWTTDDSCLNLITAEMFNDVLRRNYLEFKPRLTSEDDANDILESGIYPCDSGVVHLPAIQDGVLVVYNTGLE